MSNCGLRGRMALAGPRLNWTVMEVHLCSPEPFKPQNISSYDTVHENALDTLFSLPSNAKTFAVITQHTHITTHGKAGESAAKLLTLSPFFSCE